MGLRFAGVAVCLGFVLQAQTPPQPPVTQSGPFWRHLVSRVYTRNGCTLTINGQSFPATGSPTIAVETLTPVLRYAIDCNLAGGLATTQITGTAALEGFAADFPISKPVAFDFQLPPNSMPTRLSVTASLAPGKSRTEGSTYDLAASVIHGIKGGADRNCATGKDEKKAVPKGTVAVATSAACPNDLFSEYFETDPHGFGEPNNKEIALTRSVVTVVAWENWAPVNSSITDGGGAEFRIESQYKMSRPKIGLSPASLNLSADLGKANARTAQIEVGNTAGGYLDWYFSTTTSTILGPPGTSSGGVTLRVSPASADTIAPRQTTRFTVTVDTSQTLGLGTFSGNIVVRSWNASQVNLPVQVTVGEAGGTDSLALSGVQPATGSTLGYQSEQRFSALAKYTLASANTGLLTLEVFDQGGALLAKSDAVALNRGTNEAPLQIPVFKLPATVTKVSMKAVLRAGSEVTESAAVVYTVRGDDRISINYDSLRGPKRDYPPPHHGVALGSVDIGVDFKMSSVKAADIVLIVREPGGTNLGVSKPARLEDFRADFVGDVPGFMVPVDLPALVLSAVMLDPATGERLAEAPPVTVPLVRPPDVKLEFGWRSKSLPVKWIGSFDASTTPLAIPLVPNWPASPGAEAIPAMRVTWDIGEFVTIQIREFEDGKQPYRVGWDSTDTYYKGSGPREAIFDVDSRWTPEANVEAHLESKATQKFSSDPTKLSVTSLKAVFRQGQYEQIVAGTSKDLQADVYYFLAKGDAKIVRRIRGRRDEYTTAYVFGQEDTVVERVAVGKGSFTDKFQVTIPLDQPVRVLEVSYRLEDGSPADKISTYSWTFNEITRPAVKLPAGTSTTVPMPGGQINNAVSNSDAYVATFHIPGPYQAAVGQATVPYYTKEPYQPKEPKRSLLKAGARAPDGVPEWIGIAGTWRFEPQLPAGSFTGDMVLEYADGDFPDDANFEEAKMQVIAVDPATGLVTPLATTLDRELKTASVHLDGLASMYSIAVQGPFTKATLNTPAASFSPRQTLALVNTGTGDAESAVTAYLADGSVEGADGVKIAPGARVAFKKADSVAPGAQITTSGAVLGIGVLDDGAQLEGLELMRAPMNNGVLPDIVRDASGSTTIHIANVSSAGNLVRMALWNADGSGAGIASFTLEGKARAAQSVELLFPEMPASFRGYLTFQGARGVVAAQVLRSGTTLAALAGQPLVTSAEKATVFTLPYFSAGATPAAAYVTLINLTTADVEVTLTAYKPAGTATGAPVGIRLARGEQYRRSIADIFKIADAAGTLRIESNNRGLAGSVTIESNGYRTMLPLDAGASRTWLVPYVSNAGEFATSLALHNAGGQPANVTVRAQRADGSLAGFASVTLAGNASRIDGLAKLLPAGAEQAYLMVEANQNVLPVAILGRSAGGDIAAILPQAIAASVLPVLPAPAIELSPVTLAFGEVNAGQGKELTLSVRNAGTAALTVTSVTSSNARFAAVSLSVPFTVEAGKSQNVTVRFLPTGAGAETGTLTLASNDALRPAATVAMSGTGLAVATPAPAISIAPVSLDFGNVAVGSTVTLNVTFTNTGTAPLNVSAAVSSPFSVTPADFAGIAPGASGTARVSFTPAAAGAVSRTLTVASNDPARAAVSIAVSGTGMAAAQTVTLSVDDGGYELTLGFPSGVPTAYFVNRLTPAKYPATLKAVQVFFPEGELPLGTTVNILATGHTGGGGSVLGGLTFQSKAVQITATEQMVEFAVTPITIQSGDFVVGFSAPNPPNVYPSVVDVSPPSAGRSYVSGEGIVFRLLEGGNAGNLGIRARVE